MAVLPIRRILIAGRQKDRKAVLELLQRQGVLEIQTAAGQDDFFKTRDMSRYSQQYAKNVEAVDTALEILDKAAPEDKGMLDFLAGRREISQADFLAEVGQHERYMNQAYHLLQLDKQRTELEAELPRLELALKALEPWQRLDIPLNLRRTKTSTVFAGSFAEELGPEELTERLSELSPQLSRYEAELISKSKGLSCYVFVCAREEEALLEEALRQLNLVKAPLSETVPAAQMDKLRETMRSDEARIAEIDNEIKNLASEREHLRLIRDYYALRADKYEVLSGLAQSERVFLVSGYLAEEKLPELERRLGRYELALEAEVPEANEEVPVVLKNGAFAAPVESVIESYSMPARGELDPTGITACFYYLLFGLMLGDAAYGLLMFFGSLYCLKKYPKMEEGMRKAMTLFMYCGISTTFWGVMLGSFFGDSVNVIATTFFNRPDIRQVPLWFEPVSRPMQMLVFAFLLGIIHLFTGLGVKFYSLARRGAWKDALYDVVFWYLLVGGGIVYLLTMGMFTEMLGLPFTLPAVCASLASAAAAIGVIGIILTSGRESKNWFKRILKGIYGAYNVTGYLSDILSYSRLLALGLATSVIATVFNKMGSMLGNTIPGIILFILVFVIGHTLNLAINALGAYVHTNRLQFVEFFGKFYDGGGRKLSPFKMNSKYYLIMEE